MTGHLRRMVVASLAVGGRPHHASEEQLLLPRNQRTERIHVTTVDIMDQSLHFSFTERLLHYPLLGTTDGTTT